MVESSKSWNGSVDQDRGPPASSKPASASATTLCEVLDGSGTASLSEVLDLMDLAAGRTAFRHVGGMTVTISFQDLMVESRIPRGSMVRASAQVIAVGKSSVLLRVLADVEHLSTRKFVRCISAYATFVAVSKNGAQRASKVVPMITSADGGIDIVNGLQTKTRLAGIRQGFAKIAKMDSRMLAPHLPRCGPQDGEVVPAVGTVVKFQKQYLPRHKNFSGMVFGGDLLETMERVATYCCRRFVRGFGEVNCIAIKYLTFIHPIDPMNLWCLSGRVAAVLGPLVYVEVEAAIDKEHNGIDMVKSNEGLFAMVLTKEDGRPVDCSVGIGFEGADEQCLRAHRRAVLWMEQNTLDCTVLQSGS